MKKQQINKPSIQIVKLCALLLKKDSHTKNKNSFEKQNIIDFNVFIC